MREKKSDVKTQLILYNLIVLRLYKRNVRFSVESNGED